MTGKHLTDKIDEFLDMTDAKDRIKMLLEDVDKLAGIKNNNNNNKRPLEEDETDPPNDKKRQTTENYWSPFSKGQIVQGIKELNDPPNDKKRQTMEIYWIPFSKGQIVQGIKKIKELNDPPNDKKRQRAMENSEISKGQQNEEDNLTVQGIKQFDNLYAMLAILIVQGFARKLQILNRRGLVADLRYEV